MNTFKRKALATAVLGTLGVAGSAHAIFQDPNNLGQALIYPYYTVNNDPSRQCVQHVHLRTHQDPGFIDLRRE